MWDRAASLSARGGHKRRKKEGEGGGGAKTNHIINGWRHNRVQVYNVQTQQ
jgi:hypothetical protein